jgi:hypothetical protein
LRQRNIVWLLVILGVLTLIILWGSVLFSNKTEEEMINDMNTPENVQLLSKTIDNPKWLLSSPYSKIFLVYQTQVENKSEFAIRIKDEDNKSGTTYCFVKYKELSNCSDGKDSNLTIVYLSRKQIRLFYYSKNILIHMVKQNIEK